ILIPFFFVIISHSTDTLITENHQVVYTQCSNKTSSNPSHVSLLTNLSQQFITQSSKSSFFQTVVADEKTAISGSFQCRNDLTPDECRSCVSKFSDLSKKSCGKDLPTRIQLHGCYARYEEEEDGDDDQPVANTGPDQILHRDCSKRKIKKSGFEEMKYAAFVALESGVMSENRFCEMTYESIHVVAQCNGKVGSICDCGDCINNAVRIAGEDECRYSVSGEIYLDSCSLSYDYRDDGRFGTYKDGGDSSPKVVAFVVGGLAILALGIGFCNYFSRSCGKKKDDW
ncbi:hypothetical protein C2S51_032224, partial [Perilla frutescens var. frutescens]